MEMQGPPSNGPFACLPHVLTLYAPVPPCYTIPMKCPRDGSALQTIKYEADIEVDQCPSCHGMWLDEGELRQIQETVEHDYSQDLASEPDHVRQAYALGRPTHTGAIACPKCQSEMSAKEYAYCSQVIVDVCPEGHGMWLDAGEVQALEKFFERTRAEVRDAERHTSKGLWATLLKTLRG